MTTSSPQTVGTTVEYKCMSSIIVMFTLRHVIQRDDEWKKSTYYFFRPEKIQEEISC